MGDFRKYIGLFLLGFGLSAWCSDASPNAMGTCVSWQLPTGEVISLTQSLLSANDVVRWYPNLQGCWTGHAAFCGLKKTTSRSASSKLHTFLRAAFLRTYKITYLTQSALSKVLIPHVDCKKSEDDGRRRPLPAPVVVPSRPIWKPGDLLESLTEGLSMATAYALEYGLLEKVQPVLTGGTLAYATYTFGRSAALTPALTFLSQQSVGWATAAGKISGGFLRAPGISGMAVSRALSLLGLPFLGITAATTMSSCNIPKHPEAMVFGCGTRSPNIFASLQMDQEKLDRILDNSDRSADFQANIKRTTLILQALVYAHEEINGIDDGLMALSRMVDDFEIFELVEIIRASTP